MGNQINIKKTGFAMLLIVIALVSFFVMADYASSPDHHTKTIQALDEKKETVMELTAASTAASAAITLLPGDAATPIADKLADFSGYFLIVLCALFLEKYMVTITGYAAFKILIPAACILLAAYIFSEKYVLRQLAIKLALFGLAIVLVIPASMQVSNLIEGTYQESIANTIEEAEQTTETIQEGAEEEEKGIGGLFDKITEGASNLTKKAEQTLNNFIESLAVMLVTCCVIPVMVLVFFLWLVKLLLGVDVNLPTKRLGGAV